MKVYSVLIQHDSADDHVEIFKDLFDAVIFANKQAMLMARDNNDDVETMTLNDTMKRGGWVHYVTIADGAEGEIIVFEREVK